MQKALTNASSPDESLPTSTRFINMVLTGVERGRINETLASDITNSIGQAAGDSIESYLSNEKTAIPARDAFLWALTGDNKGLFSSSGVPTLSDFQKKYNGKISNQLVTYLYQSAQANRNEIIRDSGNEAEGMTIAETMKEYKVAINGLSTPAAIGSYLGGVVSSHIAGTALQALNLSPR